MAFYIDYDDDIPSEVLEERAAERRRRARLNHWCDVCHGHTGPGSPCYAGDEDEGTPDEQDEDGEVEA